MDRLLQAATEKMAQWPRPQGERERSDQKAIRRELGWDLLQAARKMQPRHT